MDFVRLGERYTTSYIPDKLIEGYNSLVWTERAPEAGEFELKSFDVYGLKQLLPEDTLVSHLETREVMMVETHEIQMVGEGEDAQPEITIRGRTATVIFEHRHVESSYQKKRRMRQKYSGSAAALVLMYNAVQNDSGKDVTRGDKDPETDNTLNDYSWTTLDVLPNVAITETVAVEGTPRWWKLEEGSLYPQLAKILQAQNLAIRCLRPSSPSPATVVTVNTALSTRGTIVRTPVADVTQLQFNVYSGVDRTATVQFSQLQGHIDKPQYLQSSKDYKTVVEMKSDQISIGDQYRPGESGLTGWARRVTEYDAGSPELPPEPQKPGELKANATNAQKQARAAAMDAWIDKHAKWKNKNSGIIQDFRDESKEEAARVLQQARRIDMFAGDISSLSPYVYKVHYNLGDTVMLFGDYGKSAAMVVREYVRTEDANGDRGFPGLVAP